LLSDLGGGFLTDSGLISIFISHTPQGRGILLRLGLLCNGTGLVCRGMLCSGSVTRRGNVGGLGGRGLLLHWCRVSQLEEASGSRLSTAPGAGTLATLVVAQSSPLATPSLQRISESMPTHLKIFVL
jgi:hypothetical protein